jgi:acylphosphatase
LFGLRRIAAGEFAVVAIRIVMSGRVQGVGFRAWAERRARERGLSGWIRNLRDGTVEAVFSGDDGRVDTMIDLCRSGPPHARVEVLERYETEPPPFPGFQIRRSD